MTSVENWGIPGIGHTEVLHSDVSTVDESVDSASCLVVGTANPSGINGKALAFASLPWGICGRTLTLLALGRVSLRLHLVPFILVHCNGRELRINRGASRSPTFPSRSTLFLVLVFTPLRRVLPTDRPRSSHHSSWNRSQLSWSFPLLDPAS